MNSLRHPNRIQPLWGQQEDIETIFMKLLKKYVFPLLQESLIWPFSIFEWLGVSIRNMNYSLCCNSRTFSGTIKEHGSVCSNTSQPKTIVLGVYSLCVLLLFSSLFWVQTGTSPLLLPVCLLLTSYSCPS